MFDLELDVESFLDLTVAPIDGGVDRVGNTLLVVKPLFGVRVTGAWGMSESGRSCP